jgi:antitoxin VapB
MTLSIKDKETEALVARIVELTGETEGVAVRKSLRERVDRVAAEPRSRPRMTMEEIEDWLENVVRPRIPEEERGRRLTKAEREEILGYGPGGS